MSKLLGFDYEIQYKQGCDNQVTHALSRIPLDASVVQSSPAIDQLQLLAISYPYLSWMDDLRRYIKQDSWILAKIQEVKKVSDSSPLTLLKYKVDNGFLKYKDRIVLSPNSSWRQLVFEEHHSSLSASHLGFFKTYFRGPSIGMG